MMRWVTSSPPTAPGRAYCFLLHLFEAADHMPPAFSQSAWVVYFDMSPEGLAAGDELDPLLDDPLPDVLPLPEVLPEPLPDVPEGVLPPEPEVLGLLPLPPVLDCAAATAGASAITAAMRTMTSFSIRTSFGD